MTNKSKRFEIGDVTYISHGFSKGCSGGVAVVTAATEGTFTQQCKCGARFGCQQSDNYPNKTQDRGWQAYHDATR